MTINGTTGNDNLTGTSGNDVFNLSQGGDDTVSGLGGNDVFRFGAAFTAADSVDGGTGSDILELNGDYSAGVTFGVNTIANVEEIRLDAGFDYKLSPNEASVASGATLTINATALGTGNTLFFDGTAGTDGTYYVSGGAGGDTISMGAHLTVADRVNGGGGNDTLFLGGDYSMAFHSTTLRNISDLVLFGGGHSYHFITNDANVAAGATMQVDSTPLGASDTLIFNGDNETDGSFNFDGGAALLELAGGAQNDAFFMGADLTASDRINGEGGSDVVYLAGDYTLKLAKATLQNVENLKLDGGFDYHIVSGGGIAAGATMTVDATALGAGDSLYLNFAKETAGNVIVDAGPHFVAGDTVIGGAGNDTLSLIASGGSYALTFGATTIASVERIDLQGAGETFTIATNDANVLAGQTLTVDASGLASSSSLSFNGSAESDGHFAFIGGAGNDTLTGGALSSSFDLTEGGSDTATGGASVSTFNLGAAFDSTDRLSGVGGYDNTLILNGAYSGLTVTSAMATNIQTVDIQGNHPASFTWQSPDDRGLFTLDASQAQGSLTFDFSAENAPLHFIGGALTTHITGNDSSSTFDAGTGVDSFTGGEGNDIFNFGANFTAADNVDGGVGADVLNLDGDYSAGVVFTATTVTEMNTIVVAAGHDYNLTANAATVGNIQTMIVDASALGSANHLTFNGTADGNGFFTFDAGAGNDVISSAEDDTFNMQEGGNDTVTGSGGDIFNFGSKLTAADRINGGSQFSTVNLSGNYSGTHALVLGAATMINVEEIGLTTGNSYTITTNDATVASGKAMLMDGGSLGASDVLTFDGSAETNGVFTIIGGQGNDVISGGAGGDDILLSGGGNDTVHAGGGDDTIDFHAALTAADTVDGGAGNDTITLLGDYSAGLTLGATTLTSIETISLGDDGVNYKLTTVDANVATGQTLTVDGSQLLEPSAALIFDGSAETDGTFVLLGGRGNDVLTGGAGNDTMSGGTNGNDTFTGGGGADLIELGARSHADILIYHAVSDSTSSTYDTIQQLDFSTDILQISAAGTLPSAIDAAVATGTLSTASFDANLASAIGSSQLASHHAVLFTPNAGTLSGHTFLVVDENGVAGYQASADLVIDVTGFTGTLTTGDFA